jgi:DNA repair exonuclease SbcCD ATPase subunit
LPFLNSKILDYSDRLGQPCQLDYRQTKSGDLEEKVEVTLPGKKTYRGLSRGEKMMVDLSIQCALNDLAVATGGSHVNLLICDEVIDAIDEPTLKAFVEVLESKAGTMTIFLMAHRPFLDARLPNKLLLVKRNGITHLDGEQ